jgi:hypothetical protein
MAFIARMLLNVKCCASTKKLRPTFKVHHGPSRNSITNFV